MCLDVTCTGAANDAVVDNGAAVHCDFQAVMGIVVLGRLIIRVELQDGGRERATERRREREREIQNDFFDWE